jgi:nucleotide-binding universal stress UspA family protein
MRERSMLRKIVAGVDGRPGGTDAAALAVALAGPESDVLLVGVYRDPLMPLPLTLGRDASLSGETERVLHEVRDVHAPGARTEVVCDSFPARALRHVAEREQADLLVIGSTHRADRGDVGVGRHGRQMLHDASCPVAVAARGAAQDPGALRRIVVGYDGSPESRAALAAARALSGEDASRMTVVAVVEDQLPTSMAAFGAPPETGSWERIVQARRQEASELLDEATAGSRAGGEVVVGDPSNALAEAAKGADLLVVGSRRWGPLARIALGSTADDLTRRAPCSLLLVPRPATEASRTEGVSAAA